MKTAERDQYIIPEETECWRVEQLPIGPPMFVILLVSKTDQVYLKRKVTLRTKFWRTKKAAVDWCHKNLQDIPQQLGHMPSILAFEDEARPMQLIELMIIEEDKECPKA